MKNKLFYKLRDGSKFILMVILMTFAFYTNAQQTNQSDSLKTEKHKKTHRASFDTTRVYVPHVSEGMFNPFMENPGFCGIDQNYKYNSAFDVRMPFYKIRTQGYHPFSFFASFECNAGKKKASGFGTCFYQVRGVTQILSVLNNSYSYKIQMSKYNYLRLGVALNIFQNTLDWDKMTFPDMMEDLHGFVYHTSELTTGLTKNTTWNFNAGLSFHHKLFYVGFSMMNILKPYKEQYSGYYFLKHIDKGASQYLLSSGYTFRLTKNVELSPSAQMRVYEKRFSADIHVTGVFWKHFIAGFSLNQLKTTSVDFGCSFWNILTFYASCGVSTIAELYNHFGPLDYVSANLKIQLGHYQDKF